MVKNSLLLGITTAAVLAAFLFANEVLAHPGNTAADGCHYCRTNCDKWGEVWNERHCHNAKTQTVETPYVAPQDVTPSPSPSVRPPSSRKPSPKPSPSPTPSPSMSPFPSPESSPTPSPSPSPSLEPSFNPSPSPQTLGATEVKSDSDPNELGMVTIGGLFLYSVWRAIKQKWPFNAHKIS
jgi:hypothetical protein